MNPIPSRLLAALLLATTSLCGLLLANQKFDDLRKAAEQGDASAQYGLGGAYDNGEGVAQDKVEAVKWYRKAAEQGGAEAQYNLGSAYDLGEGVGKDKVEAVKWWRKAAEQGNAMAQFLLGFAYRTGVGVAKDPVEGYAWNNLAAVTYEVAKDKRAELEKTMSAQQVAVGQRRAAVLDASIMANQAKK